MPAFHLSSPLVTLLTDKLLHIQLLSNALSLNMFQNAAVPQDQGREGMKATGVVHICYRVF